MYPGVYPLDIQMNPTPFSTFQFFTQKFSVGTEKTEMNKYQNGNRPTGIENKPEVTRGEGAAGGWGG